MNLKDKKYFFFDIDGTLVNKDRSNVLSPKVRQAISQLQKNGHVCSIATGRFYNEAEFVRKELGFHHMVGDGGNSIVLYNKLIERYPMCNTDCRSLLEECRQKELPFALSTDSDHYCITASKILSEMLLYEDYEIRFQQDILIDDTTDFYKIFILCPPGGEKNLRALKKMDWVRYDSFGIFIEPARKSQGILKVMDYLQAPYEKVVVFGDSKNDLSMFSDRWFNIAMGNAVPELKEKADYITKSVYEDGVVHALKKFRWI